MPYCIKCNGLVLGILLILISAGCSSFGLYIQTKCAKFVPEGHASYFALSQLTYPQLGVIFDLAIAVKCFGVGVSYLVVIGDLMPKVVESLATSGFVESHLYFVYRNFWITCFMAIVVPLSFLRHLNSLKYASGVALSSVAYLVVLVVVHFFESDVSDRGEIRIWKPHSIPTVLSSFPIFVFAYTCHQNMFSLVNELADKSAKSTSRVILQALGVAVSAYLLVGVTGYMTFGEKVVGNIVVLYPPSLSSTVGRIAIVILVTLSYPLQCHPCRASTNHVLHYLQTTETIQSISRAMSTLSSSNNVQERAALVYSDQDAEAEEGNTTSVPLGNKKFIVVTTAILVISYLVAITITSLEHVLAFVGSTGSTSISFILPGIFGYKLIGSDKESVGIYERSLRMGSLLLSLWGVVVMVICLSATIFFGATH